MSGLSFSFRRSVPVVLQNEVAECGLACLAMVAGRYGLDVDLLALRSRFGVGTKGMTLKQLMACAERLGLVPRAVRAELEAVSKLARPAILHWNLNHFVVLVAVKGRRALVHDPARGARWLGFDELSRGFSGVALELRPALGFKRGDETARLELSQLWGRARGLFGSALQIVVLALVIQALAMLLPYFMQVALDQVVASGDEPLLPLLGFGFAMLTVVKVAAEAARAWSVLYLGSALNLQLGANLLRQLLKLPLEYFQKRQIGDLQSRFHALGEVRETLTGGLIEGVVDGVMAAATLALMLAYSGRLAAITLAAVVLYAIARVVLFAPLKQATLDAVVKRARSDSLLLESLRAMLPIKVFGRECERHGVWLASQTDAINAEVRGTQLGILGQVSNGLVTGLEHVFLVWAGVVLVQDGALSVGMLIAFLAYRQMFSARCVTLVDKLLEYRMLSVHLARVADIALAEPEANLEGAGIARECVRGELRLEGVCFRYGEDEPWLFRNLDLVVSPGECVAFAGRSGQGKTTLLKIMMGLLRPCEGRVLLDGVDIRRIGLAEYRALCAAVMQDDHLVSGSLRDNISFQEPEPDDALIEACAVHARIRDDILAMPMGFESLVGDMGAALSGGQVQRVLLARALYARPRLVFLDEATSALDAATEAEVNASVRTLGITRVMIAHRRETLALADRVIDLAGLAAAASRAA